MKSRILIAITLGVFLAVFGLANNAYAAWAYDNEDFHCDVDSANDLHITYKSDTKMHLKWHFDDGFPNFSATPFDAGYGDSSGWNCKWSGRTVYYCEWVHVGVAFEQLVENYLDKQDIYWTWAGDPVDTLPGPGFGVRPPSGSVTTVSYRFFNSTSESFDIGTLRFRLSGYPVQLDSMMYGMVPGFTIVPTPDSFTVAPGDSQSFTLDVSQFDGSQVYYVMAQGVVFQDTVVGHFVQQHQHYVTGVYPGPTLTEWGLIVFAGLFILTLIYVLRKRKGAILRSSA